MKIERRIEYLPIWTKVKQFYKWMHPNMNEYLYVTHFQLQVHRSNNTCTCSMSKNICPGYFPIYSHIVKCTVCPWIALNTHTFFPGVLILLTSGGATSELAAVVYRCTPWHITVKCWLLLVQQSMLLTTHRDETGLKLWVGETFNQLSTPVISCMQMVCYFCPFRIIRTAPHSFIFKTFYSSLFHWLCLCQSAIRYNRVDWAVTTPSSPYWCKASVNNKIWTQMHNSKTSSVGKSSHLHVVKNRQRSKPGRQNKTSKLIQREAEAQGSGRGEVRVMHVRLKKADQTQPYQAW